MKQPMLADLRRKLTEIFDQVSEPLYHDNGEGPFFMATREQNNDVKFFVYEVNDVEAFLAEPEKVPATFSDANFLFSAADTMDLAKIESSEQFYSLFMMRLVPDSPACRLAIKRLQEQNPDQIVNIALIDPEGKIIPASSIVDSPVLLS